MDTNNVEEGGKTSPQLDTQTGKPENHGLVLGRYLPPSWLVVVLALSAITLLIFVGARTVEFETRLAESQQLIEELPQRKAEMRGLSSVLKQLRASLLEGVAEQKKLTADIEALKAQKAAAERMIARRNEAVQEYEEALKNRDALRAEASRLKEATSQSQAEYDTALKRTQELKRDVSKLEAQILEGQRSLEGLKAEFDSRKAYRDLLEAERKEMQGLRQDAGDAVKALKDSLGGIAGATESIRQSVKDVRTAAETAVAESGKLADVREKAEEQSRSLVSGMQKTSKELTEGVRLLSEAESAARSASKTSGSLDEQLKELARLTSGTTAKLKPLFEGVAENMKSLNDSALRKRVEAGYTELLVALNKASEALAEGSRRVADAGLSAQNAGKASAAAEEQLRALARTASQTSEGLKGFAPSVAEDVRNLRELLASMSAKSRDAAKLLESQQKSGSVRAQDFEALMQGISRQVAELGQSISSMKGRLPDLKDALASVVSLQKEMSRWLDKHGATAPVKN